MLEINKLQKKYENFELNCSMKVEKGYITALVGENGAGKSTTFKALLGLIKPDGGEITIFGKKPLELTAKDRAKMGIVLTDSGFSGYLKVKDIIPVMESLYTEFEKSRFLDLCNKLDIPLNKSIKEFSTGMKAKLKVLCALTHKAKFLLLDEPTAGLDPKERIGIRNYIAELSRDKIILFATHVVSDIECIADKVLLLKDGEIIATGTPSQLIENMQGKVGEVVCTLSDVADLQGKYHIGNIRQRKNGMVLRLVGDELPEEAVRVDNDIDLEDVYLYYFE